MADRKVQGRIEFLKAHSVTTPTRLTWCAVDPDCGHVYAMAMDRPDPEAPLADELAQWKAEGAIVLPLPPGIAHESANLFIAFHESRTPALSETA